MGQLKTIKVFILGNVANPGGYNISSMSTIFNALFMAGGPTKKGSMRNIKLRRKNKIVKTIDLYEYLLNGDINQDPQLKAYDTIIIPPIGNVVKLSGSVKNEAIFEVLPNTSLHFLINKIGQGYQADADKMYLTLNRIENEKRVTKTINNLSKKNLLNRQITIIKQNEV